MEAILSNKERKVWYILLIIFVTIMLILNIVNMGLIDRIINISILKNNVDNRSVLENNTNVVHVEQQKEIPQSDDVSDMQQNNKMLFTDDQHINEQIEKYINTHNEDQVKQVLEISEHTPLDYLTASIIVNYSEKLDVPISLIMALIELESKFKQYEVGAAEDRGYCQIIPTTEKWLADTYGHLLKIEYNPERIFEPEYNIGLGTLYLYHLKKAYKNDLHRILSEYNRGPYNLKAYYDKHQTYETTYSRTVLKKEVKYKKLLIAQINS